MIGFGRGLVLLLPLVSLLLSSPAHADPEREKYDMGVAALRNKDCQAAADSFNSVKGPLRNDPSFINNAAQANECAGNLTRALEYYRQKETLDKDKSQVREKIGELRYRISKESAPPATPVPTPIAVNTPAPTPVPESTPVLSPTQAAVKAGLDLYDQGEYGASLEKLKGIGPGGMTVLDGPEQITVHKYQAFCLIVLQRPAEAKKEFKVALLADPAFDLDPAQVPPKIMEVFREAKQEVASLPQKMAALSLLPGAGQWTQGRPVQGAFFSVVGVGSIAYLVLAQGYASQTAKYASEAGPLQKSKFNSQASTYGLERDGAAVLVVAVIAASSWEAYRAEKQIIGKGKQSVASLQLVPMVGINSGALALVGRF